MLARSPNRKRAVEYLAACGATAITVIDRDGVGVVIVGLTAKGIVAGRWWIAAQDAQKVASGARRLAGARPDTSSAIEAVKRSAASLGATLTDDGTAINRANYSMQRLDLVFEEMRRTGVLREFNLAIRSGARRLLPKVRPS